MKGIFPYSAQKFYTFVISIDFFLDAMKYCWVQKGINLIHCIKTFRDWASRHKLVFGLLAKPADFKSFKQSNQGLREVKKYGEWPVTEVSICQDIG